MAKNSMNFNLNIKTTSDLKGLNDVKKSLDSLRFTFPKDALDLNPNFKRGIEAIKELKTIKNMAGEVETAFDKAFDFNTGILNTKKLNTELKNIGIDNINAKFSQLGIKGKEAMTQIASASMNTNLQLRQTSSVLDSIGQTLINTLRWTLSSSVINKLTGILEQSVGYVRSLDSSLNDIRIVTGKSADEMERFAASANKAAKELGKSTTDYTNAALIYYQQGLSDEEVETRTDVTLKTANVTGQSAGAVSEQLTAVWNGYQVATENAEASIDILAAVAASSASDLEELSTGMSKVASAAAALGVGEEQLASQISTIISVTRQAPESVGTALKTIYARMSDIESGAEGAETTLGNYTQEMADMGINVLNANGSLRDMGEVIEEIGGKWTDMSREQQIALAQTMAGTRQYNNLMALFDNWGQYTKMMDVAANSAGTLQEQQDIYMESTAAHLQELETQWEDLYDSILDESTINTFADTLTNIIDLFTNFVDAIGGGKNLLLGFGAVFTNVFSKQIAQQITPLVSNILYARENAKKLSQDIENTKLWGQSQAMNVEAINRMVTEKTEIQKYYKLMSAEEINQANETIKQIGLLEQQKQAWKENLIAAQKYIDQTKKATPTGITLDALQTNLNNGNNLNKDSIMAIDRHFNNLQTTIDGINKKVISLGVSFDKVGNSSNTKIKILINDTKEFINKIKELQNNTGIEILDQKAFGEFDAAIKAKDIEKLDILMSKYTDDIKANTSAASQNNQKMHEGALAVDNYTVRQKLATDALNKDTLARQKQIQTISQTISAIGGLAFGLQSLSNIPSIFEDENASDAQKFLQLITTLSMTLPTLGANLIKLTSLNNALATSYIKVGLGIEKENIGKKISTYQNSIELAQKFLMKEGLSEEQKARYELFIARRQEQIAQLKNTSMTFTEIVAQKGLAVAIKTTALAIKDLTLSFLASPMGVVTGILLIISAVNKLSKSGEKATEAFKKSKEEYEQAVQDVDNLKNSLEELNNKIAELQKKLEDGSITLTEQEDLARLKAERKEMELELKIAERLAEVKAHEEAVKAAENQDINGTGIYSANDSDTFNAVDLSRESKTVQTALAPLSDNSVFASKETYDQAYAQAQENINNLKEKLEKLEEDPSNGSKIEILSEQIAHAENSLASINDQYTEYSEDYENLSEEIDEDLAKNMQLNKESLASYLTDNKNGQWNRRIAEAQDAIWIGYQRMGLANELSQDVFKDTSANKEQYDQLLDADNLLLDPIKKEVNEDALKEIFGEDTYNEIDAYLKGISGNWYDWINTVQTSSVTFKEGWINTWNEIEANTSKSTDVIKEKIGELDSALKTLGEGNELDEETASALEAKYSELKNIWDRNSAEYLKQLEYIREREEEILKGTYEENISDSSDRLSDAIDKYEDKNDNYRQVSGAGFGGAPTNLKNGNVQETYSYSEDLEQTYDELVEISNIVDELTSNKYELELSITDDLLTDVDNIITDAEKAQKATELIGDGFKVAAKDSKELFNIFPELAENAKVLADGSIQLDNTMTKIHLENAGIEIDADKEKTTQAIENRITELKAAKATAQAKLDEIRKDTSEEIDIEYYLGDTKDEILVDEAKNQAQVAQDTVTNSANSAKAQIKNWAAVQEALFLVAQTAREATEEPYEVTADPILGNRKIRTFSTVDTKVTDINKDSDEAVKQKQAELKAKIEKYLENQIGSYESQIADLVIALSDLNSGMSSIGTGGDSGSSSRSTKDLKEYKEEFDRYWEFNKLIEKVTDGLEEYENSISKMAGLQLAGNLEEVNKLLDQQAQAYKYLAEEQKVEQGELQNLLSTYGVAFNDDGSIANYADATAQALATYDNAINQYNAGLLTDEAFSVYENAYNSFKENLERYDSLYYDEMKDTLDKINEISEKQRENNLQIWEIKLDVKLEKKELERDWNDFLKEINEDFKSVYKDLGVEMANITKNISTYIGDSGSLEATLQAIKDVEREIDIIEGGGQSSLFGSTSEAQEKLKELNDELQDQARSLHDLYKSAWDAYLEGIDQAADKMEDLMNQFELIDSELDYQRQLIELIYGSEAYGLMNDFYKAQEANNMVQISSLKQQVDMWKAMYDSAEAGSEEQARYYELWTTAQENLNSKVLEHIKILKEDYSNTVTSVIKNLEKQITGGFTLDDISEEWDRLQEKSKKYYDDVTGLYKIQNLANKITDSISKQDNVKDQQKLQALYDKEINYLREKKNLTEYDLNAAEARYEIALKEIALEEAQNNKNAMKLTRDSNGNWTYQYIADQDDVSQKQQELSDAYYKLYKLGEDAYNQNLADSINLYQRYIESLADIESDDTLSDADKQKKRLKLESQFQEDMKELNEENSLYRDDLQISSTALLLDLYKQDEESFKNMTFNEQQLITELKNKSISSFSEIEKSVSDTNSKIAELSKNNIAEISRIWDSLAQNIVNTWSADDGNSVMSNIKNAYGSIITATEEYRAKIKELEETIGQSFGEAGIRKSLEDTKNKTEELKDKTKELTDISIAGLSDLKSKVDEAKNAWEIYGNQMNGVITTMKNYLEIIGKVTSAQQLLNNTPKAGGFNTPAPAAPGGPGSGPQTPQTPKAPDTPKYFAGSTYRDKRYTYWIKDETGQMVDYIVGEKNAKYDGSILEQLRKKWGVKTNNKVINDDDQYSFKTGGYTGVWNNGSDESNGRLAFLHQKELVLNEDDTKNILSAVEVMRAIVASTNNAILGEILSANSLRPTAISNNNKTDNSNVNNFNISMQVENGDVEEIKMAILNLPNLASQYSNRKLY